MRRWDWDMHDLRKAMKVAHRIVRVGRRKYELYTTYGAERGKGRKLIVVDYPDEIFVITGAEGSR